MIESPRMVDSHCHIADEVFGPDLEAVIGRAREAGLERALIILEAGNAQEAAQAARACAIWEPLRVAIGVHPHAAHGFADRPAKAAEIVRAQAAATPEARAVGEIGLDYHYDFSAPDVQRAVFREQLALAGELDWPVVVHTREAERDTIAAIQEFGGAVRGVLHCFTGSADLARQALGLGFYISFSGIVTFPRAEDLRETARIVPLDRLLIETDSPFLSPAPNRGGRNEPARVVDVARVLATIAGVTEEELAAATTANFHRLFRP
ncbi:MAG: TatD family hydrolase [Vicinamibacterales bacterium]